MTSKKHINIITLGCSKNLVDSEKIMGQLQHGPFRITHDADGPSDIVVINTCGFIGDAKEESIDTILQYTEAKKQGLVQEVIVTGCLSQRYKDALQKEIPEADAWFGVDNPSELFTYLKHKYNEGSQERLITTPSHFAYLKIAEGCDRTCSFCAIPLIRGKFISRSVESLVEEAAELARKGVKEILLIAQDLSYYGFDLEKRSMLADLLRELVKVSGIEWIRLHYAYPKNFPTEVIDLMAKEPKICRYLDIPLQHISDPVLKSMRRNTDKASTLALLEAFRSKVPDVALRTTLLVGYPGETMAQFEELLAFVKETRFERLGVFTYSPEEGTKAFELEDTISDKEKQKRADKIMEAQQEISFQLNQEKIGKTFRVLIDREEDDYFVGRTEYDSPEVDNEVYVTKQDDIVTAEFYSVRITSASDFDLFGEKI
ncbi:MAG: 30S ribosomal protein S12 methylthiotransferase RimO [Bacteroidetes bacterium]|nr:MAG: 30S ribosomal protein S12 methylthiotransferase RimO [Bacteroidota bacterium]